MSQLFNYIDGIAGKAIKEVASVKKRVRKVRKIFRKKNQQYRYEMNKSYRKTNKEVTEMVTRFKDYIKGSWATLNSWFSKWTLKDLQTATKGVCGIILVVSGWLGFSYLSAVIAGTFPAISGTAFTIILVWSMFKYIVGWYYVSVCFFETAVRVTLATK